MFRKIAFSLLAIAGLAGGWLLHTAATHYVFWAPRHQIGLASGDVTLSGTLVLPPGPGPHPAAIMLHGAGPGTRSGPAYRAHARALLDAAQPTGNCPALIPGPPCWP